MNTTTTRRFVDWGHSGIGFWNGSRTAPSDTWQAVAWLAFAVGPQGPIDGTLGSTLRRRYREIVLDWVQFGVLPEGAHCPLSQRWLYDRPFAIAEVLS